MNSGPSLFDIKIQELAKLDNSGSTKSVVNHLPQIPDIIQSSNSIDALDCIDQIH